VDVLPPGALLVAVEGCSSHHRLPWLRASAGVAHRAWSLRRLPLAVINMQVSACNDTLQVSYSCRLSLLWGPAGEALGKALEHQPGVAWPLVHATLAATQAGFLSGADRGTAALNM